MILLELVLALVAAVRLSRAFGAGADFVVYFSAIRLWFSGQNPYSVGVGFIYPPSFLVFFSWLALFPGWVAGRIFFLGSLSILTAIFYSFRKVLGKWCLPLFLLMLNWFPVLNTLGMGQVNLWVLGCCLLCFYDCNKGRLVRAGLWLGVAAGMKVLPLLLLPYFWLTGKKKTAVVGLLTFLMLNMFAFNYFSVVRSMATVNNPYYFNQSLPALMSRMWGISSWGWVVGIIVVYGLALAKSVSRGFGLYGFALMLTTMTLISPVAWSHYFVFMIPAIIFLVSATSTLRRGVLWGSGLLLTGVVLTDPSLWQKSNLIYNHGAIGGVMIWLAMMINLSPNEGENPAIAGRGVFGERGRGVLLC